MITGIYDKGLLGTANLTPKVSVHFTFSPATDEMLLCILL